VAVFGFVGCVWGFGGSFLLRVGFFLFFLVCLTSRPHSRPRIFAGVYALNPRVLRDGDGSSGKTVFFFRGFVFFRQATEAVSFSRRPV